MAGQGYAAAGAVAPAAIAAGPVGWIALAALVAGTIAYDQFAGKKKTKARQRQQRAIKEAGGLANYDPQTWGAVTEGMKGAEGTGGPAEAMQKFLADYKDTDKNLRLDLEKMKPFLPATLASGSGYQHAQDLEGQFGELPDPQGAMQAYGNQAGQMAQTNARGLRAGQGAMAARGLGGSSAMASLAGQSAMNNAQGQGNLYSQLYAQAQQQKERNVAMKGDMAQRAFSMQRDIAQMSMGSAPTERTQQKASMWPQIAALAGQAAGAYFGSGSGAGAAAGAAGKYQNSSGYYPGGEA